MNVLCGLDIHLRRWQEPLDWGGTRCRRCGATWPYRVFTTEELFPGLDAALDRAAKANRRPR